MAVSDSIDFDPPVGVLDQIAPKLRRIVAPNPSPMTFRGTNTYVLGQGDVVVIDPGPASPAHLAALLRGLEGARVAQILVTHAHLDHSPLAADLARATGAPVYGFGPAQSGRSDVMQRLVAQGMQSGGEGIDANFTPDHALADGETLRTAAGEVTALWTPGHLSNHMCFAWEGALFSGDHIMGWASTMISPPDGDLTQFMASAARLLARSERVYYPGHGAPVTQPQARVQALIDHRKTREATILHTLSQGPKTVASLTAEIYHDTPAALHGAAARNVFAHLIDLVVKGEIHAAPGLSETAKFSLP